MRDNCCNLRRPGRKEGWAENGEAKNKKDLQETIRVPETAKWSTFVADSFVKLYMAEHLHGILTILVLNRRGIEE